ncbi:fumarate reductase subunit C [Actinomadura alba]|uniref:Fumarate reductase subunit C n=1 Tax=Actinomadura alba TaxID=406431 RepID=A0ABR7LXW2_9ACTN|nr:fumarate reductase subunit C [Actinomadura alba]MBC6469228.1 fumarate reductase subunit C [Actinomadura alba]
MSEKIEYTPFHPRWYRPHIPVFWWLRRRSYLLFVLRELSSVFVAWFVVFLLLLVNAVAQGPDDYRRFLDWSAGPGVLSLNVIALCFIVLHAVTWLFMLAPHAMVVRLRGKRLPAAVVGAGNLVAWVLASALVASLILG